MKKLATVILIVVLIASSVVGCNPKKFEGQSEKTKPSAAGLPFTYKVDPETFEVSVEHNGKQEIISKAQEKRKVTDVKDDQNHQSWTYPEENIGIVVKKENDYLDVSISSTQETASQFTWPVVEGSNYMLPLGEGKSIPANDPYWKNYLNDNELNTLESLSMPFFAINHSDYASLFIMKDNYNNTLTFNNENNISFKLDHEFTSINKKKEYGFRIYITQNDAVDIAKLYKSYIVEKDQFKTLEEKAKENNNIEKLYGAPHIYLWDMTVISEEDIDWNSFREQLSHPTMEYVKNFLTTELEQGQEARQMFDNISQQDYVDQYQKVTLSQILSQALLLPNFFNKDTFTKADKQMEKLLKKGVSNLNEVEMIELNKRALFNNLPSTFKPVEQWANDRTVDLLKDINKAGITNAWLGLDNWKQGFIKPEMVDYATKNGYLIGPYDSYHSIHEPGQEKWHSATFTDKKLYKNATIEDKNGEKIEGFQNVGRKLNPTLSLPSVQSRVEMILNTGVSFNSWFIDCDATGEAYDDYSDTHITTKEEDIKARLDRMTYIAKEKNMVIGSEGGNDFASSSIAFAHGIELPSFSWMDEDMKKNKESEYYIGRYYSPKGGAPEKVTKQIPIKEEYKKIFLDPTYKLPLYKLVYNDSIITTYHWDWSTFKIVDEVEDRMLYEILYNVPPLYHLDKYEWEKHGKRMTEHTKVWSDFSKKVIHEEMTDFQMLTDDRLVQLTQYGNNINVVANFSNKAFTFEKDIVQPGSLIIYDGEQKTMYQP